MRTEAGRDVPAALKQIQQRLEHWRRTRRGRDRIPEGLWGLAVEAARTYGLNKTARAVGLDYYSLKKRIAAADGRTSRPARRRGPAVPAAATFVELAPWTGAAERVPARRGGVPECVLEFERVGGAKLRVQLTGVAVPDLVALTRSFWSTDA
jgi:hypothetical protein